MLIKTKALFMGPTYFSALNELSSYQHNPIPQCSKSFCRKMVICDFDMYAILKLIIIAQLFPDWIDKGAQQISVVILRPVDRFVNTTCGKKATITI